MSTFFIHVGPTDVPGATGTQPTDETDFELLSKHCKDIYVIVNMVYTFGQYKSFIEVANNFRYSLSSVTYVH